MPLDTGGPVVFHLIIIYRLPHPTPPRTLSGLAGRGYDAGMTLTELRYIVAVARERHFGRAAEACFVSQPTLSVAVKKPEDELGVALFERRTSDVSVTAPGKRFVAQAQRVLEETGTRRQLAEQGRDPLTGPLRLGTIYTIGPYLLPHLIPALRKRAPKMPLLVEDNFTSVLIGRLRQGRSTPLSSPCRSRSRGW